MAATLKVRLRFAKLGDLRLVSHHDLARCLERMARRARLPLAESQGFNRRPKITFALSLALGIEGRREVVELELAEPMEPAEVLRKLADESPAGLEWLSAEPALGRKVAQVDAVSYAFALPSDRRQAASIALLALLASSSHPYVRSRPDKDRDTQLDLRPFLLDAQVDLEGFLRFRLGVTNSGAAARPEDVLDVLELGDLTRNGTVLVRTDVELAPDPAPTPSPASPTGSDSASDSDDLLQVQVHAQVQAPISSSHPLA